MTSDNSSFSWPFPSFCLVIVTVLSLLCTLVTYVEFIRVFSLCVCRLYESCVFQPEQFLFILTDSEMEQSFFFHSLLVSCPLTRLTESAGLPSCLIPPRSSFVDSSLFLAGRV